MPPRIKSQVTVSKLTRLSGLGFEFLNLNSNGHQICLYSSNLDNAEYLNQQVILIQEVDLLCQKQLKSSKYNTIIITICHNLERILYHICSFQKYMLSIYGMYFFFFFWKLYGMYLCSFCYLLQMQLKFHLLDKNFIIYNVLFYYKNQSSTPTLSKKNSSPASLVCCNYRIIKVKSLIFWINARLILVSFPHFTSTFHFKIFE